eukprot:TRINITY_DN773205_c0_g1_i1.p1 TRINITY_DN773205_c0_g1~~TRINITY_DN773205_c0_g1_i1.p1  ORF type:complete len:465 (-),score=129.78 TRINITY_DN773205_c0_g1_i1:147-1541(-)
MKTVIVFFALLCALCSAKIVNNNAIREINLDGHIARMKTTVDFTWTGTAPKLYTIALPQRFSDKMSYIEAKIKKEKLDLSKVESREFEGSNVQLVDYSFKLPESLTADKENLKITIKSAFIDVIVPFPAQIEQSEIQMTTFRENLFVLSPYNTISQKTKISLSSSVIEGRTKVQPSNVSGNIVTYGPYENIGPYRIKKLRVHFQNEHHFKTIEYLEKEIEVSHWGNVAFEEHVHMLNSGATLKGEFSRAEYTTRMQENKGHIFRQLIGHVPLEAEGLYYRDVIGNISTSNVREEQNSKFVQMNMRFPLFGAWKTKFYWGFNLPSETVLTRDLSRLQLKVPISTPIEDATVQEMVTKIILPEGSSNVVVTSPFDVQVDESKRFTYIDNPLFGRPVIQLSANNLASEQNKRVVTIEYTCPVWFAFHEPILLITFFFVVLIGVSLLWRLSRILSFDSAEEISDKKKN